MRAGFVEMREGFAKIHAGMAHIVTLLERGPGIGRCGIMAG